MKKFLVLLILAVVAVLPLSSTVHASTIDSDFETYYGDPVGVPSYGLQEQTGFYIWTDDASRRDWHMRWTSVGADPVYFTGEISLASGLADVDDNQFSLSSWKFEAHGTTGTDSVKIYDGSDLVANITDDFSGVVGDFATFDVFVNTHEDGFDFSIIGDMTPSWLLFDLDIIGTNEDPSSMIFIGALEANPDSKNFKMAAPVPEPATLLLLGSGLVGLAFMKRRKK